MFYNGSDSGKWLFRQLMQRHGPGDIVKLCAMSLSQQRKPLENHESRSLYNDMVSCLGMLGSMADLRPIPCAGQSLKGRFKDGTLYMINNVTILIVLLNTNCKPWCSVTNTKCQPNVIRLVLSIFL